MKTNPLKKLGTFGQSIWLDYIRRDLIESGELQQMIVTDGLRGMTSNPAIFEQAIGESHGYDQAIGVMAHEGQPVPAIYETLSQEDVRSAADVFLPLYEKTDGRDGFVSLEVNPHLARDTEGTVLEARRLWAALDRPNVLIKVPGTAEGLPAIRRLLSEGVNVNVTLLFGLARYRQVAEAYLAGIEARTARGLAVNHVASVASFFVSRIDAHVDPLLESFFGQGAKAADTARGLHGQVAVASARLAYQEFKETFGGPRFKALARAGARPQRLLWASTGTKNPAYSDVKYVEALIGAETVNTAPLETLAAYRDHGDPKPRLELGVREARRAMVQLNELGIRIDDVAQQLEDAGVEKFNLPFDQLMAALAQKS
jgi:transaldolase